MAVNERSCATHSNVSLRIRVGTKITYLSSHRFILEATLALQTKLSACVSEDVVYPHEVAMRGDLSKNKWYKTPTHLNFDEQNLTIIIVTF